VSISGSGTNAAATATASYQYSAPEIFGALVYNRSLTAAELTQVQARMSALFAAYGVPL